MPPNKLAKHLLLLLGSSIIVVVGGFHSARIRPQVKSTVDAASVTCGPNSNGEFVANAKGCHFFFYCHNGQALEANCPGNLWFNLATGICDVPDKVECTMNLPPPQLPVVTDEPVECPAKDTDELTFLGSQVDCGRYYICYHGQPRRQQCIGDLHWNTAILRCDYPKNAKCPIKREPPICPRRGQEFFPHPEQCDYFIYCINGISSVQQCPFYHHWDVVTNACRWRNLARCAIAQQ